MTTSEPTTGGLPNIVVLGVPRTGTTLLRRLLDSHPDICCPGETFLLTSAARFLRPDHVSGGIEYGLASGLSAAGVPRARTIAALRAFVEGFFREIADRAGKPRWASKTAIDSFYLPEIEQLMAGHARFVCVVRHGLDTALSLDDLCRANEVFIREIHEFIVREPRPLVAFAQLWAQRTAALLEFAGRHASDSILLRYEDLVSRPEDTLARLGAFLGLQPGALVVASLGRDAPSGLGDWKSFGRTGVDEGSVGRWKSISAAALHDLAPIVNPVLARAGYPTVEAGGAPDPDQAMRRYEMSLAMKAKLSRAGEPDRG